MDIAPAGCCCCCCCLHSLGSTIGAAVGSTQRLDVRTFHFRDEKEEPFPTRRDAFEDESPLMSVSLLYWLLLVFLVAATAFVMFMSDGFRDPSMLGVGLFVALMILPGLQLGASLLTLFAILIFYPQRRFPLRRIGRITLWSYVGAILGLLAMTGCTMVIVLSHRRW